MIVIGYDGSEDSRAAIERAGKLLRGQPAVVTAIWDPFAEMIGRAGVGSAAGVPVLDFDEIDRASEDAAAARAAEGADLATAGERLEGCVAAQRPAGHRDPVRDARPRTSDAPASPGRSDRGLTGPRAVGPGRRRSAHL